MRTSSPVYATFIIVAAFGTLAESFNADAGTSFDAGAPSIDAGTPPSDAGTSEPIPYLDCGTAPPAEKLALADGGTVYLLSSARADRVACILATQEQELKALKELRGSRFSSSDVTLIAAGMLAAGVAAGIFIAPYVREQK